jgi:hypothetical protein
MNIFLCIKGYIRVNGKGVFMAIILGALGLLVGLTAFWLASMSLKKIESHGDLLLQGIRNEQRKSLDEMKTKVEVIEKKNERMSDLLSKLSPKPEG